MTATCFFTTEAKAFRGPRKATSSKHWSTLSSKFNSSRAPYVLPSWCVKPPVIPLPPVGVPQTFLQAEGRLTWNKPDRSWVSLTASSQNMYKISAITYYKVIPIQGYMLRFSISVLWSTRKISCGLTAYQGSVFHASSSWNLSDLGPEAWWKRDFEQPDFTIPNFIGGVVDSWMSVWP